MPVTQDLRGLCPEHVPAHHVSVGSSARSRRCPGVEEVNVNHAAETAQVRIDSETRIPELIDALDRAGYPVRTQTIRLNVLVHVLRVLRRPCR